MASYFKVWCVVDFAFSKGRGMPCRTPSRPMQAQHCVHEHVSEPGFWSRFVGVDVSVARKTSGCESGPRKLVHVLSKGPELAVTATRLGLPGPSSVTVQIRGTE